MILRFAVGLLLLPLGSCCTRTVLAPQERAWLRPYNVGTRAVFRSNQGTVDTVVVTSKEEYYTNEGCNWFEIGPFKQHTITLHLQLTTCHPRMDCRASVQISKQKPKETALPLINFFGLEHAPWVNAATVEQAVTLSTTHRTYPSAYAFSEGVNAAPVGGPASAGKGYLHAFVWDWNDGLIRYETQAGEIFELLGD